MSRQIVEGRQSGMQGGLARQDSVRLQGKTLYNLEMKQGQPGVASKLGYSSNFCHKPCNLGSDQSEFKATLFEKQCTACIITGLYIKFP